MASASVIGAVLERYSGFAIAGTAKAYFDEAPLRDGANATVAPPYVVLKDDGTEPDYDFELNPVERTELRFEVYAGTLADADAVAAAIRYNGGSITAGAGMDFGALPGLTGQTVLEIRRLREQRFQEADRSGGGALVFRVRMNYRVTTKRAA